MERAPGPGISWTRRGEKLLQAAAGSTWRPGTPDCASHAPFCEIHQPRSVSQSKGMPGGVGLGQGRRMGKGQPRDFFAQGEGSHADCGRCGCTCLGRHRTPFPPRTRVGGAPAMQPRGCCHSAQPGLPPTTSPAPPGTRAVSSSGRTRTGGRDPGAAPHTQAATAPAGPQPSTPTASPPPPPSSRPSGAAPPSAAQCRT